MYFVHKTYPLSFSWTFPLIKVHRLPHLSSLLISTGRAQLGIVYTRDTLVVGEDTIIDEALAFFFFFTDRELYINVNGMYIENCVNFDLTLITLLV